MEWLPKRCIRIKLENLILDHLNLLIKSKSGLGLGIFIGKTLLEKNYANILCKIQKLEVEQKLSIKWKNKDLIKPL